MPDAAQLAQAHWDETPLFLTEEERYSIYPWLYDAAEFRRHEGEKVLEVGCGEDEHFARATLSALTRSTRIATHAERPWWHGSSG